MIKPIKEIGTHKVIGGFQITRLRNIEGMLNLKSGFEEESEGEKNLSYREREVLEFFEKQLSRSIMNILELQRLNDLSKNNEEKNN